MFNSPFAVVMWCVKHSLITGVSTPCLIHQLLSLRLSSLPLLPLLPQGYKEDMCLWSGTHTTHNSEHNLVAKKESSSRKSARTEEREGRCLRSPCRSRPCTRDRQLGFWGATTRLPNPPPLFIFLKLVRADFFFLVERSSSSSTSWKLVKDRDHRSAREGMIRSSFCCISSFCSYMLQ